MLHITFLLIFVPQYNTSDEVLVWFHGTNTTGGIQDPSSGTQKTFWDHGFTRSMANQLPVHVIS